MTVNKLRDYLLKNKIVTGPLEKNSSHSHTGRLRNDLLGIPQFFGDEIFLTFGSALHEVFLEGRFDAYNKLPPHLQIKIDKMVDKLQRHPVVKKLMAGAVKESKQYKKLFGVLFAYILDILQPKLKIGSDLKTTTCKTKEDCIKKGIEYGYHKQAQVYMKMENLKEFYFIFINKEAPYDIFIVSYLEFKEHLLYAESELEFLLYFYKHYGNICQQEK